MADDEKPMSGEELIRWREQQEEMAKRRAMRRALGRLLVWIGAGAIALKAAADIVKGTWEWLLGR